MGLSRLPRIDRLVLATVTALPDWHPLHDTFEPFPVHAWLIRHPDGAILVDTGVGSGNAVIDEWYRPQCTPLPDALRRVGAEPSDVATVVLSHLHFDHCGQQGELSAPVYVQAAELEAAQTPGYTVREWAEISEDRLRIVQGDREIARGITLVSTPGHSPGHQSVVAEAEDGRVVIAAQCAFHAAELRTGEPAGSNCHGDAWLIAARSSLDRLRALAPAVVHLSHDAAVVELDR